MQLSGEVWLNRCGRETAKISVIITNGQITAIMTQNEYNAELVEVNET